MHTGFNVLYTYYLATASMTNQEKQQKTMLLFVLSSKRLLMPFEHVTHLNQRLILLP